jgi:hypothetical protein
MSEQHEIDESRRQVLIAWAHGRQVQCRDSPDKPWKDWTDATRINLSSWAQWRPKPAPNYVRMYLSCARKVRVIGWAGPAYEEPEPNLQDQDINGRCWIGEWQEIPE